MLWNGYAVWDIHKLYKKKIYNFPFHFKYNLWIAKIVRKKCWTTGVESGTKLPLEEVRKPEQHVSESEMHAGKLKSKKNQQQSSNDWSM